MSKAKVKTGETKGKVIPIAAASEASEFEIENDIPAPDPSRRRRRSKYPFDALEIGQSFFVGPSEKLPEPAKQLASTVSSANRRYKNEDGTYERRFTCSEAERGDESGARVWRIA